MKKLFLSAAIAAVVVVAGYFSYKSMNPSHEFTETEMENIEALADDEESSVELQCETSSVIYCQTRCVECGRTYRSVNIYGKTVNQRGKCICGSSNLLY
jgi:hypothetical protein